MEQDKVKCKILWFTARILPLVWYQVLNFWMCLFSQLGVCLTVVRGSHCSVLFLRMSPETVYSLAEIKKPCVWDILLASYTRSLTLALYKLYDPFLTPNATVVESLLLFFPFWELWPFPLFHNLKIIINSGLISKTLCPFCYHQM